MAVVVRPRVVKLDVLTLQRGFEAHTPWPPLPVGLCRGGVTAMFWVACLCLPLIRTLSRLSWMNSIEVGECLIDRRQVDKTLPHLRELVGWNPRDSVHSGTVARSSAFS